ncbi:RNA-metabolising metallo-beta-lactamase [Ammonifex degensii KC4]|uniref:RNA-metabolising metallo-beta-lactamase n=1 Tax=Ammonifex degensii (strain DSM 10501 / KC4) TaxID=429009 RepID=C9RDC7_AMMDK|nr:exonuclease [Ammonifex degensii]ACX52254.1 RNA-metabolising metallo-beta-lactamase [Ammonifex degensii KC4]
MPVSLTFYDGTGCIGGNKILLEDEGIGLFLDFGTNFGAEGLFFDEFLRPRATFGLADLLVLNILPPLKGLYRSDLEYPGLWEKYSAHPWFREVEIRGILLSHAHFDHCGYLTYLRPDVPVLTSLTTALATKALQDTSSSQVELCYITPRELKDGLLRATDYRSVPHQQRPFWVPGESIPEEAHGFWEKAVTSRRLCSQPLKACSSEAELGPFRVRLFPVDHSIPGAGAFAVKTSAGWVVYTGDLRLHGKQAHLTRQFMQEAARLKPKVLICEGTHPEVERPVHEQEVAANCFEVVKKAEGLVIADFGPRNVERLLSFLEIAGETERLLTLTPKDIYLLEALRAAGEPGIPDPMTDQRVALYVRPKALRKPWEEELIARFGERAPERLIDAARVKFAPQDFILCFSYYDFHALLDIEPEGGTYIYSSSEAYDEEMLMDHERVRNWINFFGFRLYGTLGRDRERSGFHASGHIHGPGIEELVETVKPEVLIPVHTENREFFRRFEGICRVVWPERGRALAVE